jgi:hypothetical protein
MMGAAHASAQILTYCFLLFLVARNSNNPHMNDFWLIVIMGVLTILTAPTVMGSYLLIALNSFGRHWNEAFSSLRIEDHKGFLRLKIDATGRLTVYPIVLDKVPHDEHAGLQSKLAESPIELAPMAGN